MKRVGFLLSLLVVMTGQVRTQTGVAGPWRIATVVPDGSQDGAVRDFFLDLRADGTSISGTGTGVPMVIRDGRIDGSAVTLNGVINNQTVSFTGNLAGDEIVFNVVGLAPQPVHVVARRVARVTTIKGSVSDGALMQQLMKQANVRGVSIAVIKDFKVVLAVAYGVADAETGTPMTTTTMLQAASISKPVAAMASLKAVQEKRCSLDQDINTILKSWKLPTGDLTRSGPVTPRTLMR